MAKVVVVGANGFIGSHLVEQLAQRGHTVTAFDRYSSGELNFDASAARVVAGDFLNQTDVEAALEGQEYVFHFLSMTNPATVASEPRLDLRTNVNSTLDLLDVAVDSGVQRVYYASSGGAVYGNQGKAGYSEDDRTEPMSPYGIGKATIENYLRYYRVQHGLDFLNLRISNPYGTRQHPRRRQGLIPIALGAVLAGQPVTRYGDGSMVRDYAFVPDVVRMIAETVGASTKHDTYNIGSGVGHSVTEVLECIREVTGRDFAIEQRQTPATFVERVILDVDRYRGEFAAFEPTPLHEGVAKTWEHMLATPDAAPALPK